MGFRIETMNVIKIEVCNSVGLLSELGTLCGNRRFEGKKVFDSSDAFSLIPWYIIPVNL